MPTITRAAGMQSPLLGMANIREQIIPVIDLAAVAGCTPTSGLNLLLVTEYARSTGRSPLSRWTISCVLTGVRCIPPSRASAAVILPASPADSDGQSNSLAMVLDVEQILYDIIPSVRDAAPKEIRARV